MRTNSRRGFLLLEALISLSLLALGLAAVFDAFAQTRDAARRSERDEKTADCISDRLIASLTPLALSADCQSYLESYEPARV